MILVTSRRAIEFACQSKACAPPPVGTGGSGGGGSSAGYGGKGYANSKLSKSRAPGADPNIEWQPEGSDANSSLKGVVTTPGGRKFAVSWDEFDVGPRSAKMAINQYSKLLDEYPDTPEIPLAIGRNGVHDIVGRVFGKDPYYKGVFNDAMDKAVGFAVNDRMTSKPLFVAMTAKIDQDGIFGTQPEAWGVSARGLTSDQQRQYIMTHEFGHIREAHARSQMGPNDRRKLDSKQFVQLETVKLEVTSIGGYGKSKPTEMVAEAFAVQSHGLVANRNDASILKGVTDFALDGKAPKKIEWQS